MVDVDIIETDMALIDQDFAAFWFCKRDVHPLHDARLALLLNLYGSGHTSLPGMVMKGGRMSGGWMTGA